MSADTRRMPRPSFRNEFQVKTRLAGERKIVERRFVWVGVIPRWHPLDPCVEPPLPEGRDTRTGHPTDGERLVRSHAHPVAASRRGHLYQRDRKHHPGTDSDPSQKGRVVETQLHRRGKQSKGLSSRKTAPHSSNADSASGCSRERARLTLGRHTVAQVPSKRHSSTASSRQRAARQFTRPAPPPRGSPRSCRLPVGRSS